jgi:hypothetical protein
MQFSPPSCHFIPLLSKYPPQYLILKHPQPMGLTFSEKVRQRPWQWLDNRSGKRAWTVHGKSELTEAEKDETGEDLSQEHARHFLRYEGDFSQRIRPGKPSSKFRMLPWYFAAMTWKCGTISPRNLRQNNWILHHYNAPSHTSSLAREFLNKNMTVLPPTKLVSISPIEDKTERPQFWHSWGNRGRIAAGVEYPHRKRLAGCI